MAGSGLQTSRFKQVFSTTSVDTVYTTESYVNNTISNYLNTNSVVNINVGNGISILNTVTGSTYTTVNVGLSAQLSDLDDVNVAGITTNEYLQWTGSCWQYGPGASFADLSVKNLNEFYGGININSVIFSPDGVCMYFKEDRSIAIDYLTTPILNGIKINKNSSYPYSASVETDFINLATSPSNDGSYYYIIVKPDGTTMKVQKKNIDVRQFSNFSGGVIDVLAENLVVTNSFNSSLYSEGLCLSGTIINLNLSNYLSGAGGILPIIQGGTCSGTSAGARINLGLSYNSYGTCYHYDIMGYSRPEFREGMVGDNIRLVAGVSSINIGVSGSGYDPALPYSIESEDGTSLTISVLTGGGGSITSVTFTDPVGGFPYIYEDFTASVIGTPGSAATIGVCVSPIYINFGQYTGDSGYGLRGNRGDMEVKHRVGSDWEKINKSIEMTELSDVVNTGAFGTNDFLIYSGTSFVNYPITGDMTINSAGVATITTGGISIGQIEFGAPGISITDFQNITGTTGNIQQQLDDKLYTYSPANINRNILVLNGTTTTGTCASIISYDGSASGDGGNCPQVPMISHSSHTHGVCFQNLYHGFTGSTLGDSSATVCASVCLYEPTREVVTQLLTQDFLNFTLANTGGLAVGSGGKTQLKIESLNDYGTCINNYEDYIAIGLSYPLSAQPNKRIHIKDLIKIPFYTDTSQPASDDYFQGALAFFTEQGSPGTSYLGIATGNGTSWYGISGIDII